MSAARPSSSPKQPDKAPTQNDGSRKKKIALGIVGGFTAAGLLVGAGTTLSGWHDKQDAAPAPVSAGSLSFTNGADHGWYDMTGAVQGTPAPSIDPASFMVSPGDRLEKAQEISIELTGANIAAELTAGVKSMTGDLAVQGLTGTIRLVKGSFDPASGNSPNAAVVASTPILNNAVAPQIAFNSAVASADGKYTVVTDLVFNPASGAGQNVSAVLEDTTFVLKQVRQAPAKAWVIPDNWLAYYVSTSLGVPVDKLTTTDALKLTTLDLSGGGGMYNSVSSLEGMQYATNLTSVNLSYTKIADLSQLSGATKLTDFIGRSMSNLTSIDPLAGLMLVNIDLEWTQIQSISAFAGMSTLQNVDLLGVVPVTDITSLAGKQNLVRLVIDYTSVNSLEPLRFDAALAYFSGRAIPANDWSPVYNVSTVIGMH